MRAIGFGSAAGWCALLDLAVRSKVGYVDIWLEEESRTPTRSCTRSSAPYCVCMQVALSLCCAHCMLAGGNIPLSGYMGKWRPGQAHVCRMPGTCNGCAHMATSHLFLTAKRTPDHRQLPGAFCAMFWCPPWDPKPPKTNKKKSRTRGRHVLPVQPGTSKIKARCCGAHSTSTRLCLPIGRTCFSVLGFWVCGWVRVFLCFQSGGGGDFTDLPASQRKAPSFFQKQTFRKRCAGSQD